ncbi:polysaccharide biosynthesis C-terminal domain-containing protein [Streptomyces roseirectus]|uniref:Probable multidrug resistance protein NorM n=1 Tax=Streptomyces roseirectus TaxID=2768066 RepID=A0A7H0IK54_9ACTN|nr:MATE family efflux transporter [Streptomyces roseirectus]QNP73170.1 polysaccharide biosynthesis C-terminal domain-containing protein [Streptomyces roseirectus]
MTTHRAQLITLARPLYLSLLASVLSGLVNTLWVAPLGPSAVAAVAVATTTENVLLGVALVFSSGTTVLLARARGERDPVAAGAAVRGGWVLFALVTPVVAGGGYLLREPLARLLTGGEAPLVAQYFAVSLPGLAVFYAQNLVDGVLKGTGDTKTPMRLALLTNGLILVADPVLIGAYGVRGAAVSTVLCRCVALGAGVAVLRRRGVPTGKGTPDAARRVLAVGLPMALDFTVRQGGGLVLVAIVARIGVTAVAAYGIAYKVLYLATMAFYAVRQAAVIHTAYTGGETRTIARAAAGLAAGVGIVAAGVFAAGAPWIMAAFGAGDDVTADGVLFLRCVGPYLVLMGAVIALGGVFEGSGGGVAGVTVAGTAVQLPLAYGLSGFGLAGVCAAMAVSMGVQGAALVRKGWSSGSAGAGIWGGRRWSAVGGRRG